MNELQSLKRTVVAVIVVAIIKGIGGVFSFETSKIAPGFVGRGSDTVTGASWGSLADLASTDSLSEVTAFQSFRSWSSEFFIDSSQPETEGGAEMAECQQNSKKF